MPRNQSEKAKRLKTRDILHEVSSDARYDKLYLSQVGATCWRIELVSATMSNHIATMRKDFTAFAEALRVYDDFPRRYTYGRDANELDGWRQ